MNKTVIKVISLVLLVIGAGLIYWGYQQAGSVESQVSEALTGAKTDEVMQMYIGGAVCLVVGLFMFFRR
ncbi:hypothetical protein HMF8227_00682 [Saliniradius amylolyticus]|uniref:DUF3185 family protein n=1 Tax=Saliniradius amylolyticus TaxID=2183582 RepID=A0A2S2E0K8_9ALTE|nr:DUF3185 family protein [Saliniradius amylolyticus]AWL11178.1 hypothetical protein HMF8227_00682 [Saliniradius amylolyticus]